MEEDGWDDYVTMMLVFGDCLINGNFYLFFRITESLPILLYIHNIHEGTMGRGEDPGCVCPGV